MTLGERGTSELFQQFRYIHKVDQTVETVAITWEPVIRLRDGND